MKLKKTGNIPEKLIYICQPEQSVKREYDDLDSDDAEILNVIPTFISDATNIKTLESGRSWANVNGYYDHINRKYVQYDQSIKPIEYEFDNEPIDNIKIVNLEHRSQGGRAYKVIIHDKFYVDLREDILLEVMLNKSITEGIVYGQFIWARVGAEMKLIRMGSELHNIMLESTALGKMKKISPKDYVVGGIYESKTKRMVYLGTVKRSLIYIDYNRSHSFFGSHHKYKLKFELQDPIVDQLWINLQNRYGVVTKDPKDFQEILSMVKERYYSLEHCKTSTMIKKSGQYDIPDNYLEQIRNIANDKIEETYNKTSNLHKIPFKHNEESNKLMRCIDSGVIGISSLCLPNEEVHIHPRLKIIYDNKNLEMDMNYTFEDR